MLEEDFLRQLRRIRQNLSFEELTKNIGGTPAQIIEDSEGAKSAILFLLKHFEKNRPMPSHDFGHALKVARLSAKYYIGFGGDSREEMVALYLGGLFHDAIRTSEAITDKEGVIKSSKLFEKFAEINNVSFLGDNPAKIIRNPSSVDFGSCLELADCMDFLNSDRIRSFAGENSRLREMVTRDVAELYRQKFGEKISKLPKEEQDFLDKAAQEVLGRKVVQPALSLGTRALRPRNQINKVVKDLFKGVEIERFAYTLDSLLGLALISSLRDPAFSKKIFKYAANPFVIGNYPKHDKTLRETARFVTNYARKMAADIKRQHKLQILNRRKSLPIGTFIRYKKVRR